MPSIIQVSGGNVAPINNQQAQASWIAAGGNPAAASNMAAIVGGESSGYSDRVVIDTNNQPSVGLYQINGGNFAGLAKAGVIPSADSTSAIEALKDPTTNTNAAIYLSQNGQNIKPWATTVNKLGLSTNNVTPAAASQALMQSSLSSPSSQTPIAAPTAVAPISGTANFVPNADPALQIDDGLSANPWYNDRNLITGNPNIRKSVQPISFTVYLDQYRLNQRLHNPTDNTPIQVQLNCSLREITIESKHIVNRVPSRTGMHVTLWGMAPDLITGSGSTGVFMNQAGITDLFSTNTAPAGMANTGYATLSANHGGANSSEAYRVAAQDAFMEFMKLFQMNGVTWFHRQYQPYQSPRTSTQVDDNAWSQVAGASTAQQNARNNDVLNRGYVSMSYKNNQFYGYFKSLTWTQDAEKPFSWDFNFVFQVERTFTALYYPSSATAPQPTATSTATSSASGTAVNPSYYANTTG